MKKCNPHHIWSKWKWYRWKTVIGQKKYQGLGQRRTCSRCLTTETRRT